MANAKKETELTQGRIIPLQGVCPVLGIIGKDFRKNPKYLQDPGLAEESLWAHPIERPEVGSVLLASLKAPDVLNDPRMWQVSEIISFPSIFHSTVTWCHLLEAGRGGRIA